MKELVTKYGQKMINAGLANAPLVCGLDDELYWNQSNATTEVLEGVLEGMEINSLICAQPAEPYQTILQFLAESFPQTITPRDCETRTFLHDLPVVHSFSAKTILEQLRRRKSVIVMTDDIRIITFGTVSPEQAFVTFSSVCFSTFVLFFSDYLSSLREGQATENQQKVFSEISPYVEEPVKPAPTLLRGPFTTENQVTKAMIEAGKYTVDYRLVDSYFGNISYRLADIVYISQTGSSLDNLAGCIDPCPLDGSSCAGITASSELTAHNEIFLRTDNQAILHGHPKFTVILSMDCELQKDCPHRDQCHIKCSHERFINDIPIVPGEVGTGPTGLCNTLPSAIKNHRGAIVWGHGLFTIGTDDFNEAFQNLLDVENMCKKIYFERIRQLM